MIKFEIWSQSGTATTCCGRARLELRCQNGRKDKKKDWKEQNKKLDLIHNLKVRNLKKG